ncbi:MAG: NUDIX domain-containing protein [Actinomycetota bacterium]
MSVRVAAYGICRDRDRVLLVATVEPDGARTWTLPGGRIEHGEDPIAAVVREVDEEAGLRVEVDRLLGVDARSIPASESWGGVDHQNVGIYYRVQILGGSLRPEIGGTTVDVAWTAVDAVRGLRRSALVDVGLRLDQEEPPTGHVVAAPTGGLLRH